MKRIIGILVSLLIMLCFSCETITTYNLYSLSGSIESKTIVTENIEVKVGSQSVFCSKDGSFVFTDIPNGNYIVTPTLPGVVFVPENQTVVVKDGNLSGISFKALGGNTVFGNAGGGGYNATEIKITMGSQETMCDAKGNYVFYDVVPGTYTVQASLRDIPFMPSTQTVSVLPNKNIRADFIPCVNILGVWWTSKNLNVATFRNGDSIPLAHDLSGLTNSTNRPISCFNNYDSRFQVDLGRYYNYKALTDPRGIAPLGFRIPTAKDWDSLQKLKTVYPTEKIYNMFIAPGTTEEGTGYWNYPVAPTNHRTGLDIQPGGYFTPISVLNQMGSAIFNNRSGSYWTSTRNKLTFGGTLPVTVSFVDIENLIPTDSAEYSTHNNTDSAFSYIRLIKE